MVWDETEGARGCSEIATALFEYMKTLPETVNKLTLYSDCCAGQNRNQYLTAALHNILQSDELSMMEINQKYLESGHTQMECDSVHSTIERSKKNVDVYVPRDWHNIITLARKRNPYKVLKNYSRT